MTNPSRQLKAYRLYLRTDLERNKVNILIARETNYKAIVRLVSRYDLLQKREDKLKRAMYE